MSMDGENWCNQCGEEQPDCQCDRDRRHRDFFPSESEGR